MMDWFFGIWPWWFSGFMLGIAVPVLFILSGYALGISSSLRHIGSMCLPNTNVPYLKNNNWRGAIWNLVFVMGIVVGGFIAIRYLSNDVAASLPVLPPDSDTGFGLIRLGIGGMFVGFGARYAGGCTSGHSITGIANLNWPSLVSTLAFFAGGLFATWVLGSWLF
ncbi:MAG TPA: YeeE/YedE thiosulfate transporter family protein [Anaerolineae bacterium]|nr:YeeE/YedE thiosulfate transporter family protein [Anaerolineae bacterium]